MGAGSDVQARHRPAVTLSFLVLSGVWGGACPAADDSVPAGEMTPDVQRFYGPLRARDLTPFGYLRLDMRPAYSGAITPGKWAVEAEIAYQNTWALNGRVEKYLRNLPERRNLTSADIAAIQAMPGENFLLDLELAELDLTLHRQLTPDFGAFVILSGAAYGGGELDGLIEQFHSAFGIEQAGRRGVTRNQMNVIMDLESQQYVALDAGSRNGLLDPTFGLRYTGVALPAPWSMAIEVAVKVPLAGQRDFLSTGRVDTGLQASFMRRGAMNAFYGSIAVVDYAGSDDHLQPDARVVPTLVLGIESHLSRRLHGIAQVYASPSIYDQDDTSIDALTVNKYQLSLGLRYHWRSQLFTVAMTENLANMNNTPDVGFQLGWAYRPPAR